MRRLAFRVLGVLTVTMLTAGVGLAAAPTACACSCARYSSPEEAVRAYDAIFVGVPTRVETDDGRRRYEVKVRHVYTGDVGRTVIVSTNVESTACGVKLDMGKERQFFAGHVKRGSFSVSSCGPATLTKFDVGATLRKVYGPPRPPNSDSPTSTLREPDRPIDARRSASPQKDSALRTSLIAASSAVVVVAAVGLTIWLVRRRVGGGG